MAQSKVISEYAEELQASVEKGEFVKLNLQKRRDKEQKLQSVDVRPTPEDSGKSLEFTYHYKNKDTNEVHEVEKSVHLIVSMLELNFLESTLYTTKRDVLVKYNKKLVPKMQSFKPTFTESVIKGTIDEEEIEIDTKDNEYLTRLGIVDQRGQVARTMKDTYHAINRFVQESVAIIEQAGITDEIHIVEYSNNKGHFAFALFDYLTNYQNLQVRYHVFDDDANRVKFYNNMAEKVHFNRLEFATPDNAHSLDGVDYLVLLIQDEEQLDTLLQQAVKSHVRLLASSAVITSQMSQQLVNGSFKNMVKHELIQKKMADLVAVSFRSSILEAAGYVTHLGDLLPKEVKGLTLFAHHSAESDVKAASEALNQMKEKFGVQKIKLEQLLNE